MTDSWRIDELQSITQAALRVSPQLEISSARVRAVPDARTIRYYTTIGLIDRPAEMRGRVAYYGRRHVLQLVCIKRLQADGLSLEEVQQKLVGATTRRLGDLAALPTGFWDQPLPSVKRKASPRPDNKSPTQAPPDRPLAAQPPASREAFWATPAMPSAGPATPQWSPPSPIPSVRLPIAAGISLEIAGVDWNAVPAESTAALVTVLQKLRNELASLGLIPGEAKPADSSSSSSLSSGESP